MTVNSDVKTLRRAACELRDKATGAADEFGHVWRARESVFHELDFLRNDENYDSMFSCHSCKYVTPEHERGNHSYGIVGTFEETAYYLAMMNPLVGLRLANLMDDEANRIDAQFNSFFGLLRGRHQPDPFVMLVAEAVLGIER